MTTKNSNVLKKELTKVMKAYCAKDNNSCATLARESGVPYSTVVRLFKGGNVPSFESVFPILLSVMSYSKTLSFVKKYYPVIGGYLIAKGKDGAPIKLTKTSFTAAGASKTVAKKTIRKSVKN